MEKPLYSQFGFALMSGSETHTEDKIPLEKALLHSTPNLGIVHDLENILMLEVTPKERKRILYEYLRS
jgi:hypothetical protein